MKKVALCSLVIGERYQQLFRTYALAGWQDYARRMGWELVVFDRLLKELPGKSPSWQKLFLLGAPELENFDQVVFLDSDILIKHGAPNLLEGVTAGNFGFVREPFFTGSEVAWFAQFQMNPSRYIVQGGVLCMEHRHRAMLEQVALYPETVMFEMPALSEVVSQCDAVSFIDPRFNALVGSLLALTMPRWILRNKVVKESLWAAHYPPMRRAIREICRDNYFIHAAGAKRDLIKAARELAK